MKAGIVVRVLGPVEARVADGWVGGRPQQRLLLAVLAWRAGQVVPVGDLIDAVWEEAPPPSAQASIQALVTRLRHILADLPGGGVERRGDGYRLRIEPGMVDVQKFRSMVRAGREAVDAVAAVAAFDQALALWRGPALADVLGTSKIEAIRSGLAEERLSAMQDRVAALLEIGRDREAAEELTSLLAGRPLDEKLAGMLMAALQRCGRQADALQVFRDIRGRLAGDLAVEPGPELQRLHQCILAGDPVLAALASAPLRAFQQRGVPGHFAVMAPRQLPAAVAPFVGRTRELTVLANLLERVGETGGTVVVSAIDGWAGVGKTALAVHWAHQVASQFPDGQLYVNLRAFGPSGRPVPAAEAVGVFLDALSVPQDRIPVSLEGRAALYRSVLAGKRMLVVLDNAADEGQVRPLLPGSAGCLVVVTSRRPLAGLAATEGAVLLTLDMMSEAEADELLAARLGAGRAAAEPEAVSDLAVLCARLPLALAVAAVRAAASPGLAIASLTTQLRDMRGRLDVLDADDPASSVRAVFSWSYQNLSGPAARMFRLLGAHPGPDITPAAAASLAGISSALARQALAELTRAQLLTEHVPSRYTFHDLLRAYSLEKVHSKDCQAERLAATLRMLDHYLHTAWQASCQLQPGRDPEFSLGQPQNCMEPESIRNARHALAWFQAEHQVLLAVVAQATAAGFDAVAWRLPWALTDYYYRMGHVRDLAAAQRAALAAALRLGDRAGQARAHEGLGLAQVLASRDYSMHAHLDQALSLYQELGDQVRQASIHYQLGVALERQGHTETALGHARQVLSLSRASGHRLGQAQALNQIGWLHAQLGDYRPALAHCRRALVMHRDLGDRFGEAAACDSLGYISHYLGNHAQAAASYRQALQLSRDHGLRRIQPEILDHLGDTCHAAGDPQAALDSWRQALAILSDLHYPDFDVSRLQRKIQHFLPKRPEPVAPVLARPVAQ